MILTNQIKKINNFDAISGKTSTRLTFTNTTVNLGSLESTEIIDTEHGSISMASPMNSKRWQHGMGVVTINGKDRLAVFGGFDGKTFIDSVELYNTQKNGKPHPSN